jgi:hypothetical protein
LTPGNESDDDASVEVDLRDDPQDDTLGSFDTAPIIVTNRTGEFRATEDMCRIILSSRSPEGQALFCGHSAHLCTRRTHQVKQSDGSDRAVPGVYEGVLNSSRKIVDDIVGSFVSFEDRAAKSKVNLNNLEQAILKSYQKKQAEKAVLSPRTPTTISFNLDELPKPADSECCEQMRSWREAASEETRLPTVRTTGPSSGEISDKDPQGKNAEPPPEGTRGSSRIRDSVDDRLAATMERLMDAMSNKLDRWRTQQETMGHRLLQEVRDTIRPVLQVEEGATTRRRTKSPFQLKLLEIWCQTW